MSIVELRVVDFDPLLPVQILTNNLLVRCIDGGFFDESFDDCMWCLGSS